MMETKHTPGPWGLGAGYEPGDSTFQLFGLGGRTVIDFAPHENMWLASYDYETDTANARLIAVAPCMFDLIQRMSREGGHGLGNHEDMDNIIRRATGADQ